MLHTTDLSRPRTPRQYLRLFFSGFAMGCADIVPGVSGGTMAFILGVYETLINAIKSFDLTALRLVLKLRFQEVLEHIPLRFLIALGLGIATAILLLSNLLSNLLENQPTYLFAFFGGLILASILAIGIKVRWSPVAVVALVAGTIFAFVIVGLPAIEDAGHSVPVLFFSGAVAICAMILPGISGSFILLILGQYRYVLDAVRSFDVLTVAVVGLGAVVGILAFSRVLGYLLKHHYQVTVAALVGFMLGSLRKIWMEAEAGVGVISEGNTLAGEQWAVVVVLLIVGFVLVSLLDHLQTRSNPLFAWFWHGPEKEDVIAEKAQALD
jgi:putative membrane protein